MTVESYDNGMDMTCRRIKYDESHFVENHDRELIEYDMKEIEQDKCAFPFDRCFTYIFYYLKGEIVYTETI